MKKGNNASYMVSIPMCVYNHEKFIAQTIEAVLNQQTNFRYQLIIGEDCSTDNSKKIIQDYLQRFPEKMKVIFQEKNVGAHENSKILFDNCNGKYIALCDGDDYWTDSFKLQKQVDFLESNAGYSICTHNVIVSTEETGGKILKEHQWPGPDHRQVSTIKDLLMFGSGGATCSVIFLTKCIGNPRHLFEKITPSDTMLQIICAQYGNLYYMKEVMGVYRRHPEGVTSAYSNIRLFNDYGVQTWNKLNNYLGKRYQYEVDHLLYHYYYPNLLKAYKEAGKKWSFHLLRLRKRRLQLKYRFTEIKT